MDSDQQVSNEYEEVWEVPLEQVICEDGSHLFIKLPDELVKRLNIKEDEVVDVTYTESWFDDGEFHGILATFKQRGSLNG